MDAILSVYYSLKNKRLPNLKVKGKKLEKIIEDYYQDGLENHFRDNGWDLSVDSIVEDILFQAFGVHISELITSEIAQRLDCEVTYKYNELLLSKKGGYTPVYYDMWEDKIIVISEKETKDKSHIFNYLEKDGYKFIGCL